MWNIVVFATMLAIAGVYANLNEDAMAAIERAEVESLAESMALYREAVVSYYRTSKSNDPSVNIDTLKTNASLPAWSRLFTQPETSIWNNYRDASGRIYIYASGPSPAAMVSDLIAMSENSELVGVYRTGDTTLYSPIAGDTRIDLPPASKVTIPNGSPVWIALSD